MSLATWARCAAACRRPGVRVRGLLVAAAVAFHAGCNSDPTAMWSVIFTDDDLDRALLSVWGSSADNVYSVGGGLGNDRGALVLHYNGSEWTEIETDQDTTFWWVWGASETEVYFGGEGGIIMRYDGGVGPPELMTTPGEETVFGMWGTGQGDVWAVGGEPNNETSGFAWHLEGDVWIDRTPAGFGDRALFKVWGRSGEDFHVVGQKGTILHYDGSDFTTQDCGTLATFLTVHSAGGDTAWAVGGPPAVACYFDGNQWAPDEEIPPATIYNGVVESASGGALVVGSSGAVVQKTEDGTWVEHTALASARLDLHGGWIDEETGTIYAVGGNLFAPRGSARQGVMVYFGAAAPPSTPPP